MGKQVNFFNMSLSKLTTGDCPGNLTWDCKHLSGHKERCEESFVVTALFSATESAGYACKWTDGKCSFEKSTKCDTPEICNTVERTDDCTQYDIFDGNGCGYWGMKSSNGSWHSCTTVWGTPFPDGTPSYTCIMDESVCTQLHCPPNPLPFGTDCSELDPDECMSHYMPSSNRLCSLGSHGKCMTWVPCYNDEID